MALARSAPAGRAVRHSHPDTKPRVRRDVRGDDRSRHRGHNGHLQRCLGHSAPPTARGRTGAARSDREHRLHRRAGGVARAVTHARRRGLPPARRQDAHRFRRPVAAERRARHRRSADPSRQDAGARSRIRSRRRASRGRAVRHPQRRLVASAFRRGSRDGRTNPAAGRRGTHGAGGHAAGLRAPFRRRRPVGADDRGRDEPGRPVGADGLSGRQAASRRHPGRCNHRDPGARPAPRGFASTASSCVLPRPSRSSRRWPPARSRRFVRRGWARTRPWRACEERSAARRAAVSASS